MAKRSRRMSKAPRRRADWVYRDNVYSSAGPFETLGTYTPRGTLIVPGPATAVGKILYDSSDYMTQSTSNITGVNIPVSPASRATGRRAKILAVQGQVMVRPSTWALGSQLAIGFRFAVFEQNPASGSILVAPQYSLWDEQLDVTLNPAVHADIDHAKEMRMWHTFDANDAVYPVRFAFRVNRSLRSNQAYAMYVETATGSGDFASVTCVIQPWLRTLVEDEG